MSERISGDNAYWYNKIGEQHPAYGRHVSDATRKKISESHKGKTLSEEHKKNIGRAGKGRKQTEEVKKKLYEANIKKVICITTMTVFDSIKDGAEYYGINSRTHISKCCKRKRKSCGKLSDGTPLVWRYLTIIEL